MGKRGVLTHLLTWGPGDPPGKMRKWDNGETWGFGDFLISGGGGVAPEMGKWENG